MAHHIDFGIQGETAAANFLKSLGYQILETNYRYQKAEIDIIALDKNELVFIEVKTRKSNNFGFPEEAVSEKKIEKLMEGALAYIEEAEWKDTYRFDVLALTKNIEGFDLHHIKDAFN